MLATPHQDKCNYQDDKRDNDNTPNDKRKNAIARLRKHIEVRFHSCLSRFCFKVTARRTYPMFRPPFVDYIPEHTPRVQTK